MFETMLEKESNIQASAPVRGCARKGIDQAARASAEHAARSKAWPIPGAKHATTQAPALRSLFHPPIVEEIRKVGNLIRHAMRELSQTIGVLAVAMA